MEALCPGTNTPPGSGDTARCITWHAGGIRRWSGFTAERYEEVMRVHLASEPLFENRSIGSAAMT